MLDGDTGEVVERTLTHEGETVRAFYASIPGPAVVGIEATGSMGWFLRLLEELGIPCRVGHPAAVRKAEQPLDPTIRKAIVEDNKVRPNYARIRVPVLAIYRSVTMEQTLKDYPPKDDQERAAVKQGYAARRAILSRWQRDLLAGVPTARVVELSHANLYMFLSNEADVLREVRAFGATLQP